MLLMFNPQQETDIESNVLSRERSKYPKEVMSKLPVGF